MCLTVLCQAAFDDTLYCMHEGSVKIAHLTLHFTLHIFECFTYVCLNAEVQSLIPTDLVVFRFRSWWLFSSCCTGTEASKQWENDSVPDRYCLIFNYPSTVVVFIFHIMEVFPTQINPASNCSCHYCGRCIKHFSLVSVMFDRSSKLENKDTTEEAKSKRWNLVIYLVIQEISLGSGFLLQERPGNRLYIYHH